MITEVRVYITDFEWEYSTEEGEMDNDLEKIVDKGKDYIILQLKDGSIDEFQNCSYNVTKRKEDGDLIYT